MEDSFVIYFIFFAGLTATRETESTSLITTEPVAITAPSLIVIWENCGMASNLHVVSYLNR